MTAKHPISPWLRATPALFVMAWGGNHFTPLLQMYQSLDHYSAVVVNLFLGMYVVGLVPGLLLAGALSDRFGRKPLIVVGVIAGIAASALIGSGFGSEAIICVGRLFAGLSVGIAMSVGTSWVKELSGPRFDRGADPTAGAKRPSLALTLGFGIGAGVAGVLAQWGPWPTITPFAVQILLSLIALAFLPSAPETVIRRVWTTSLWSDLKVPLAGHRRFVRIVLPAAPWVFGAAGVAYAIMPELVANQLGHLALAYATLLTVLTLGAGVLVQPFVARINAATRGRALLVGMGFMLLGMLLAVANSVVLSPVLALVAAVALGCAYGICIVGGLTEVQRIATAADLAGITGVYYSLTYIGFLFPVVLAWLAVSVSYPILLAVVAALCAGCLFLVARGLRRLA